MNAPAFLLLLVLFGLAPSLASANFCVRAWKNQLELKNVNAERPLAIYNQTNFRTLAHLLDLFGPDYVKFLLSLRRFDLIIEPGAGLGIAGMQLSDTYGFPVVLINTQDTSQFLDYLIFVLGKINPNGPMLKEFGGIQTQTINTVLKMAFGRTVTNFKANLPACIEAVRGLKSRLSVTYEVGYAEVVLTAYENQAMLIHDPYGAYYYTKYRAELLELYFKSLKTGGWAFIHIEEVANDTVWVDGQKMTLPEYLTRYFPDVFELSASKPGILILKKTARTKTLSLGLKLKPGGIKYVTLQENGYVVPKLEDEAAAP